jgi:hypothetical protein
MLSRVATTRMMMMDQRVVGMNIYHPTKDELNKGLAWLELLFGSSIYC